MKSHIKQLVAGVSALSCVVMLAGCGEKAPTAEELVAGAFPEDNKTVEAQMILDIGVSMDAEAMGFGDSGSFSMGVLADINAAFDSDTTMLDGNVTIDLLGMEQAEDIKTYTQVDGDDVITYTLEDGSWGFTRAGGEDPGDAIKGLDASMFEDLVLQKGEKGDTEWFVSGKLSPNALNGVDATEELEESYGIDLSNVDVTVDFVFDKKSKQLTSAKMSLSEPVSQDGVSIDGLTFILQNIVFSDKEISVPEDVTSGATDMDEYNAVDDAGMLFE